MKFKNANLKLEQRRVALPNRSEDAKLEFLFTALPLGFAESYRKLYPRPSPKYTISTVRGEQTRTPDFTDKEYIAQVSEHTHLQNVYTVYSSLKHDADLSFENDDSSLDALRKLSTEFEASNLSEGDMAFMLQVIMNISALTDDAMKAAKASF